MAAKPNRKRIRRALVTHPHYRKDDAR